MRSLLEMLVSNGCQWVWLGRPSLFFVELDWLRADLMVFDWSTGRCGPASMAER